MNTDLSRLRTELESLLKEEADPLASACNFVAFLYNSLERINWLGIYVLRADELVLGPFQGKPACVRIALGRGVCGTAAARRQTQRVADVHAFAGHIACDEASRSELVVPLLIEGRLVAVLDIDSPFIDRFSAEDQLLVETLCADYCALQAGKGFI